MSNREIAPALTPEEWKGGYYYSDDLRLNRKNAGIGGQPRLNVEVLSHPLGGVTNDQRDLHALAALCLYGQPFGFNAIDVEFLNERADAAEAYGRDLMNDRAMESAEKFRALAARIEALLPPDKGTQFSVLPANSEGK